MTELAQLVKEPLVSTAKVKPGQLKESRDFSEEIGELLTAKSQLTFSEIRETIKHNCTNIEQPSGQTCVLE